MRYGRSVRLIACAVVVLVVASGCASLRSAQRWAAAPGTVEEPFWCTAGGTPLNASDCQVLSAQLDYGVFVAHGNLHGSDAAAHGYTNVSSYVVGVGAARRATGPTAQFNYQVPDTLLYDGTGLTAQVAGIEWNVSSASAPVGFVGSGDVWTNIGGGVWQLRVWMLRPFQNEPNVFAATHPCLDAGGPIYSLSDPCYTSSHVNPTEILVSNDDGYSAPGINAAVNSLLTLPNVHLTVSAPLTDKSGTGGTTSADPLTVTDEMTIDGYPAKAVAGFPADSVRYALRTMHVNPDVLVSGINNGQNLGTVIPFSGTVGAARVGGREDIPAVALSQGNQIAPDYAAGAVAMLDWVRELLFGRAGPARFQTVVNINIPTCAVVGMTRLPVRETLTLPAAPGFAGAFDPQVCDSTVMNPADDIAGFKNGFVTRTSIGT